jgi:kynurenine formamidase
MRVTGIIDLSHEVKDAMPVHPYDGVVELRRDRELLRDGYTNSRLSTGMHAGTHIDAPAHFLECAKNISDYELRHFMGRGCLLDVRGQQLIGYRPEYEDMVRPRDAVILLTGFGQFYGTAEYYLRFSDHPVVEAGLAEFFVRRGITMLGMDLPKPDNYPFPVHKLLLGHDIFIIENMTNLEALLTVPEFELAAFPLKIAAEGSPVRALALCYAD